MRRDMRSGGGPRQLLRGRRARSQALVEFGLVLPVTLVILLGMIDFGRAFVFGVAVQQGAREAVRLAALDNVIGETEISNNLVIQRQMSASHPAMQGCTASGQSNSQSCTDGFGTPWTITVTPSVGDGTLNDTGPARGATVTVTASGQMRLLTGFLTGLVGISSIQIRGSAQMVVY